MSHEFFINNARMTTDKQDTSWEKKWRNTFKGSDQKTCWCQYHENTKFITDILLSCKRGLPSVCVQTLVEKNAKTGRLFQKFCLNYKCFLPLFSRITDILSKFAPPHIREVFISLQVVLQELQQNKKYSGTSKSKHIFP